MSDIIRTVVKWKWVLLGVSLAAIIASVIISLNMPNYYKSTVTFQPLNLTLLEPSMIFELNPGEQNIGTFGGKSDANRIITLANSGPIIDYIINDNKLWVHYGIDTGSATWRYKTQKQFSKNYKVIKTSEDALKISVYDKDPAMAAKLANQIVTTIDEHNANSIIGNKENVLKSLQAKIGNLEVSIALLTDSLDQFGNKNNLKYKVLSGKLENNLASLNEYKELADKYDITATIDVNTIEVVEQAYPSVKKAKPKRSMIVISAFLIAFFLTLVACILLDKYKEVKQELANA